MGPEIDANGSPTNKAIAWLFGQPTYIVLLALSLVAWWHYLNYSQPAQQEKMEMRHVEERKEMRAAGEKAHEKYGGIIEKFDNTVRESTRAIEKISDKIEAKK